MACHVPYPFGGFLKGILTLLFAVELRKVIYVPSDSNRRIRKFPEMLQVTISFRHRIL
jgi:hypothetical protein